MPDALPIVNGGSLGDHPTQALADLVTLQHDLEHVDGLHIAFVGRLEHRNVNAFLMGLAQFEDVKATLIPFSGQADPDVVAYCEDNGMELNTVDDIAALAEVDAIYLNGPRTVAHAQLMKARGKFNLKIDSEFMSMLKPHCVILDPDAAQRRLYSRGRGRSAGLLPPDGERTLRTDGCTVADAWWLAAPDSRQCFIPTDLESKTISVFTRPPALEMVSGAAPQTPRQGGSAPLANPRALTSTNTAKRTAPYLSRSRQCFSVSLPCGRGTR